MMKILKLNFLILWILIGSNLGAQPMASSDDHISTIKLLYKAELVKEGGFFNEFNYAQKNNLLPELAIEGIYKQKVADVTNLEANSLAKNAISTLEPPNIGSNISQLEPILIEEIKDKETTVELKPKVEALENHNVQSLQVNQSSKIESFVNTSISAVFVSEATEVFRLEPGELDENSTQWDYFIIIGVFRNKANLRNYQKYLLETYNEATQIMLASENYYYLWTKKIATNTDAIIEIDRISDSKFKNYLVGNPWIWREPKHL